MMRRRGVLLAAVALVVMQGSPVVAQQASRELPANVAIHDLVEDPDRYDGRRVVVSGVISSIAFEQGRRGSEYAVITLEEVWSDPPIGYAVKVITLTMPKVGQCQHALVQGVYHREGKQAGRPYEFFIDADAVLEGDPSDSLFMPEDCDEKL